MSAKDVMVASTGASRLMGGFTYKEQRSGALVGTRGQMTNKAQQTKSNALWLQKARSRWVVSGRVPGGSRNADDRL